MILIQSHLVNGKIVTYGRFQYPRPLQMPVVPGSSARLSCIHSCSCQHHIMIITSISYGMLRTGASFPEAHLGEEPRVRGKGKHNHLVLFPQGYSKTHKNNKGRWSLLYNPRTTMSTCQPSATPEESLSDKFKRVNMALGVMNQAILAAGVLSVDEFLFQTLMSIIILLPDPLMKQLPYPETYVEFFKDNASRKTFLHVLESGGLQNRHVLPCVARAFLFAFPLTISYL